MKGFSWPVRAWRAFVAWWCGPVCVCGSMDVWCEYHNKANPFVTWRRDDSQWMAEHGIASWEVSR